MSRLALAVMLGLLCAACEPSSHGLDDAGADPAGPEGGVPAMDGGLDAAVCEAETDGCPCSTPGRTHCQPAAGRGAYCCGGAWQQFWDGPCALPIDGSVPTCDGPHPDAGCPCGEEGAIACRASYQWRLVCTGGIWLEDEGWICC